MTVLFTVLFVAALIGWDREFGILREMPVAPVHLARFALHQSVALVSAGHHDRDRARTGGLGPRPVFMMVAVSMLMLALPFSAGGGRSAGWGRVAHSLVVPGVQGRRPGDRRSARR